jgi:carbonic anhydrase
MRTLPNLFANNRRWARHVTARNPDFFTSLVAQQSPKYLWIGCSDSRVPANEIVGLRPGEMFVHRNVANIVADGDLNCLSVLQYAVEVLRVEHVIVCGHYGCGGVRAAYLGSPLGLIDAWLAHVKDVHGRYRAEIDREEGEERRIDALCELNVVEQARHVCDTAIVRAAWRRGQPLAVHGWIYALRDGLLRDLDVTAEGPEEVPAAAVRRDWRAST